MNQGQQNTEPITEEERTTRLRLIEIAYLESLRKDVRTLTNLLGLVLQTTDPEAAAFYDKAQELEAQVGKATAR